MKAKNISYPYPVLGNEDDVEGDLKVSFKHVLGRDKIKLRPAFKLKNDTLAKLIKEEKASFTMEIECNSTFFRKNFVSFNKNSEFTIKSNLVRERVDAGFFIRAASIISDYKIKGCHPDYEGFSFNIEPGDILAVGGFTSFIAEKDFDPMRPSISSFMAVKEGNQEKGPMTINYSDDDKIIIELSRSDWRNYIRIKGRKTMAGALHSSIVLPVLADAIRIVKEENSAEVRGAHWFSRIDIIMQQQGIFDDEPMIAAQKILKNPLERGLLSLVDGEYEE